MASSSSPSPLKCVLLSVVVLMLVFFCFCCWSGASPLPPSSSSGCSDDGGGGSDCEEGDRDNNNYDSDHHNRSNAGGGGDGMNEVHPNASQGLDYVIAKLNEIHIKIFVKSEKLIDDLNVARLMLAAFKNADDAATEDDAEDKNERLKRVLTELQWGQLRDDTYSPVFPTQLIDVPERSTFIETLVNIQHDFQGKAEEMRALILDYQHLLSQPIEKAKHSRLLAQLQREAEEEEDRRIGEDS